MSSEFQKLISTDKWRTFMSGSLLNFGPCSFMSLTCDHFAANRLSQASNLICRSTVPVGGLMLLCVRRWWLLLPSEDSLERISSLTHSQGYGWEMVLVGCWAEDLIPGWLLIGALPYFSALPCRPHRTGSRIPHGSWHPPEWTREKFTREVSGFVTWS